MNKNVIGLRQEYMLTSLIASIAGIAGLVLPYAAVSGTSVNLPAEVLCRGTVRRG